MCTYTRHDHALIAYWASRFVVVLTYHSLPNIGSSLYDGKHQEHCFKVCQSLFRDTELNLSYSYKGCSSQVIYPKSATLELVDEQCAMQRRAEITRSSSRRLDLSVAGCRSKCSLSGSSCSAPLASTPFVRPRAFLSQQRSSTFNRGSSENAA